MGADFAGVCRKAGVQFDRTAAFQPDGCLPLHHLRVPCSKKNEHRLVRMQIEPWHQINAMSELRCKPQLQLLSCPTN